MGEGLLGEGVAAAIFDRRRRSGATVTKWSHRRRGWDTQAVVDSWRVTRHTFKQSYEQ
jgi:hypothetical protein